MLSGLSKLMICGHWSLILTAVPTVLPQPGLQCLDALLKAQDRGYHRLLALRVQPPDGRLGQHVPILPQLGPAE